ncbi:tetraspanin-2 isoform X2 [Rhinatrema bivittatum]|uniref:tetraspanin-2 isoform X2 n=1 Tax=Rhinatrema bivittatum TaxID=194408 RepID=UPI00112C430A|nr:tetraspanin-2 isoform X2 [Rhinatrema bivittatum]
MGRVSGTMKCIKYLLLTFNFIFWLAGSAVTAVSLWLRYGGEIPELLTQERMFPVFFYTGLYVLMGAGALMILVAFCGCCAALHESPCLLGSFFVCLLVIFAAEVTAGVFVFLGKGMAVQEVQSIYNKSYDRYISGEGNETRTLLSFHKVLNCCGKDNTERAVQVESLCPPEDQEHKNCMKEIQKLVNSKLQIVSIVGISIAGVTIFGMIFSMVLCCAIRNTRDMV